MASSPYSYQAICSDDGEIRVLTLHAGQGSDQTRISLSNFVLGSTSSSHMKHGELIDLHNIRETLPRGWTATTTHDERLIFHRNFEESSWTHPDANYESKKENEEADRDHQEEKPGFEALSYCWGPIEPQEILLVEPSNNDNVIDHLPKKGVCVRALPLKSGWDFLLAGPSLSSALRHLRYSDRPRILWVDALCINQADGVERANQVALMGRIYKQACRVVVWLGCKNHNSSQALKALELMGQQIELVHEGATVPAPSSIHPKWRTYYPCDMASLEAIRAILTRPWFTRVWIWQEIVLGSANSEVYCGYTSVSWHNLRRGIILL